MTALTEIVERAAAGTLAGIEELTGPGDVLVLAPHPDDESLGMGGAIAAADQAGHQVHVVVVTDGARSHPNSISHPAPVLSALRRAEVGAAVAILTGGRSVPLWLGYPDLAAPEHPAEFERIAHRLRHILPRVTAIWATWNGDPHPDHQRVWRLGRYLATGCDIANFFACPVWGQVQTPVQGAASGLIRRFATAPYRPLKQRAVAAHVSQMTGLITDDPDGFRMPPDLAAHFVGADEIFISS